MMAKDAKLARMLLDKDEARMALAQKEVELAHTKADYARAMLDASPVSVCEPEDV